MAAHVLTGLKQTRQDILRDRVNWSILQSALNLSCWTEDLQYNDYLQLSEIVNLQDINKLRDFTRQKYPVYRNLFVQYNRPRTREDWHKAKYNL